METGLVILGSCGSSRDTWWIVRDLYPNVRVVFLDDAHPDLEPGSMEIGGESVPIIRNWDFTEVRQRYFGGEPGAFTSFVCGMGEPVVKKIMSEKALGHGLHPFPTLVSSGAFVQPDCDVGYGGVIHPGAYLFGGGKMGNYVTFMGARCGHDCTFGDYATVICANMGGHAHIDKGVFLGLGSVVGHRVYIAPWVRLGVQSSAIKDITEPGIVAVGTPAKKRRMADVPREWL